MCTLGNGPNSPLEMSVFSQSFVLPPCDYISSYTAQQQEGSCVMSL